MAKAEVDVTVLAAVAVGILGLIFAFLSIGKSGGSAMPRDNKRNKNSGDSNDNSNHHQNGNTQRKNKPSKISRDTNNIDNRRQNVPNNSGEPNGHNFQRSNSNNKRMKTSGKTSNANQRRSGGNRGDPNSPNFLNRLFDSNFGSSSPGIEGFKEVLRPLEVDENLLAEISAFPITDNVYMVDCHMNTQVEEESGCGYVTEYKCHCGLVEKERGTNGKHWNVTSLSVGCGEREEGTSDGLSYLLGFSTDLLESRKQNWLHLHEMILGTIAKACKAPGARNELGVAPQPSSPIKRSRPKRILLTSQGLVGTLSERIQAMGIPQVGVADKGLISSMRSSFSRSPMENDRFPVEEWMAAVQSGDSRAPTRHAGLHVMPKSKETYYVSEEMIPLGHWLPEDGGTTIPIKWYARPPPGFGFTYKLRMLMGWRTNMELAAERNDADKIKDLCRRYPENEVKELVEMRMILTKAARLGTAKACKALLKYARASVDGVRSVDNRPEWIACQEDAGDNGLAKGGTPLLAAVQAGNEAVVRLLLRHGANVNIAYGDGGTPLHFAVALGHVNIAEYLVENKDGANLEALHKGRTPMEVCMEFLDWGGHGTKQYEALRKILEGGDRIKRCASCSAEAPTKLCPCKLESYCNQECQKKRWKHHKIEHKEEMELKGG